MTPTESALKLLLPGVQVRWPAQPDPTQPWLMPAPLERTVREVQGRQVVFTDGTRLALPPDAQLRLGKTPDRTADTLTVTVPPHPPRMLTFVDPLHRAPVLTVAALRARCQAGAWIEITRDDKHPSMQGKVRWATGVTQIEGCPAIVFADRSALPLPKNPEKDLHFKDDPHEGNRVAWHVVEGRWTTQGPAYFDFGFRFRNDRPAPDRR